MTVDAGDSVTTTYTVTVDTPLAAGAHAVRDVVTASAGTCASCTAIYPIVALLDTVKTIRSVGGDTAATDATPIASGDAVVYAVTVTNDGGADGSTAAHRPRPGGHHLHRQRRGLDLPRHRARFGLHPDRRRPRRRLDRPSPSP